VLSNLPEVHTDPRCYGASVGFRKGLATMRLMCDTYEAAGVYWRISRPSAVEYKLRGVSLLGILQECGELGRMMPWGH
jgi:hypothetical protein